MSAVSLESCSKAAPDTPSAEPPVVVRDSVFRELSLSYSFSGKTDGQLPEGRSRYLDLLVFEDGDNGALERIVRIEGNPEKAGFWCYEGAKRIAVVANSPKAFNPAALKDYSKISLIEYNISEDCPQLPIMGGTCSLDSDGVFSAVEEGPLRLTPLLSRIVITGISNDIDGYALLEEPRVRLHYINACAALFRGSEFIPQEFVETGPWASIGFDVGMFPIEGLQTELYCYPNCSDDDSVSLYRTCLELECTIDGETCRFILPIDSIPRASTMEYSIHVISPGSATLLPQK